MNLENAIIYDVETFPNCFIFGAEFLNKDTRSFWEISEYRDDRNGLFEFFDWLFRAQTPMIGFNIIHYDYPLSHFLYTNRNATNAEIYQKSSAIINSFNNRFAHVVWPRDRFAPQIDLFKIHHFDNKSKMTSLKSLQFNMHSPNVVDMPVEIGKRLTQSEITEYVIPYNGNDLSETKRFAKISEKAINFRLDLVNQFGIDVLNFNDTKIGTQLLEQKLGPDLCYERDSNGRKFPRQTIRNSIALSEIIFPYISFATPELQRVLDFLKSQVLRADEFDENSQIKTKGVFSNLNANIGGIQFDFGTGGIHGSVKNQRFIASDEYPLIDIDVAGMYPAIAIVNKLAPEHLGDAFTREYSQLPIERAKHKKGTVQNASFKLAANGVYGNSNNVYSCFYDPKYTMTVTVNGQLLICMLAELLITNCQTLQLIQINTDGMTFRIHKSEQERMKALCNQWEKYTLLELEYNNYSRMWISDVNTYLAEDMKGKLKQKGRLWHPSKGEEYESSISETSPPAWHKDLSALVVQHAAVVAMVHNIAPEHYIMSHGNKFDFMLRAKVDRNSQLFHGETSIQKTSRYYIAKQGSPLTKISPPPGNAKIGEYKRRNGISERDYIDVLNQIPPGTWDERIHTKNKGRYENRKTAFQAGWKTAICNDAADFDFANVNYEWYIGEARKLIIS